MPDDDQEKDQLDRMLDNLNRELDETLDELDTSLGEVRDDTSTPSEAANTPDASRSRSTAPSPGSARPTSSASASGPAGAEARGLLKSIVRSAPPPPSSDDQSSLRPSLPGLRPLRMPDSDHKPHPSGIEVNCLPTFYAVHHHLGFPSIKAVSFTPRSAKRRSYDNLIVSIRGEQSPYIGEWSESIGQLRYGKTWRKQNIRLPLINGAMRSVVEPVSDTIKIEARDHGETVASRTMEVSIAPYNHWPFLVNEQRNLDELWHLAAFVWPNQPAVQTILHHAAELQQKRFGTGSFEGYQAHSPDRSAEQNLARIEQQLIALHDVLTPAGFGIQYINPPAGTQYLPEHGEQGQKIRNPDQVLAERHGTCLDLSVLLAAILEQAGFFPLLVVIDGHAFNGCWLHPFSLEQRSRNLRKEGNLVQFLQENPVLLFNSVNLCQPDPRMHSLGAAVQTARRFVAGHENLEIFELIDVAQCRREGVMPLPPL